DPRFGPGKAFGYSFAIGADGKTPIIANLQMLPQNGQFGLLAPAIYGMVADTNMDELSIFGQFGTDPGSDGEVTIGDGTGAGTPMTMKSWEPNTITVALPRSGPRASGNVVVNVRGHHSNARQLLSWKGAFTWALSDAGSLMQ